LWSNSFQSGIHYNELFWKNKSIVETETAKRELFSPFEGQPENVILGYARVRTKVILA